MKSVWPERPSTFYGWGMAFGGFLCLPNSGLIVQVCDARKAPQRYAAGPKKILIRHAYLPCAGKLF